MAKNISKRPAAASAAGEQVPRLLRYRQLLGRYYPSLALVAVGFIAGVLWLAAIRFLITKPPETHYHANFAVFIDGQREEFKSFTYYEEIAACTSAFADNPKGRAHMHDNVNDVIHVHDKRVTYADFFNNIDWTLGPDFMRTADGLVANTAAKQWTFILNGQKVTRADNRIIGDQDKLLLSYDVPGADFQKQYDGIGSRAKQYDESTDPASCSGLNGAGDSGFGQRFKRAFFSD